MNRTTFHRGLPRQTTAQQLQQHQSAQQGSQVPLKAKPVSMLALLNPVSNASGNQSWFLTALLAMQVISRKWCQTMT